MLVVTGPSPCLLLETNHDLSLVDPPSMLVSLQCLQANLTKSLSLIGVRSRQVQRILRFISYSSP